jgi:translation elongation factor EF-Ts
MTKEELGFLKALREKTEAPYKDIIEGMKQRGLDEQAVIDYLREIAIVYA